MDKEKPNSIRLYWSNKIVKVSPLLPSLPICNENQEDYHDPVHMLELEDGTTYVSQELFNELLEEINEKENGPNTEI